MPPGCDAYSAAWPAVGGRRYWTLLPATVASVFRPTLLLTSSSSLPSYLSAAWTMTGAPENPVRIRSASGSQASLRAAALLSLLFITSPSNCWRVPCTPSGIAWRTTFTRSPKINETTEANRRPSSSRRQTNIKLIGMPSPKALSRRSRLACTNGSSGTALTELRGLASSSQARRTTPRPAPAHPALPPARNDG